MKKILLIFSLLVVFSTSAFASSVTIESVSITDTSVEINYNTSDISENDYVTILTYKAESASEEATAENIKYIDQLTKGDSEKIDFDFSSVPLGTYQIKMGGTGVDAPDSVSVTIDDKMSGNINFNKSTLGIFDGPVTGNEFFVSHENKPFIIKPQDNFIAAYSTVSPLEGYTIKEYGIRLNGENYSAKVALNSDNKYAILFTGAGITAGMDIKAQPYVVYEKAGAEDITFYGIAAADTLLAE